MIILEYLLVWVGDRIMNSKFMLMILGFDCRNINCELGFKIEKRDVVVD